MITIGEVFLIGTDDGMLFRCFTRAVGRDRTPHWIFQSREHEYVGPGAAIASSIEELERVVQRWWEGRKGFVPHNA